MIIVQFLIYTMLVGLVFTVLLVTKNRWVTLASAFYAAFLGWVFHEIVLYFGGQL